MSVTPGNDPFSGSNTKNILQHLISPKIVDTGSGAHAVKIDMINLDNVYASGRFYDQDGQVTGAGDLTQMTDTLFVAVGATPSIITSTDGLTWTSATGTLFSGEGRDVKYNGSIWVAVGQGTNTILYSTNGVNWSPATGTTFSTGGLGLDWSGSRWVAVGSGTNAILTSLDGITWTATGITTPTFVFQGNSVKWNGRIWVAVGYNSTGNPHIYYSYDGLTWVGASGTFFDGYGSGVDWNGSRWVAVGNDSGDNVVATSTDGITWTQSGITGSFTGVNALDVVWNGKMWVMTGLGTTTFYYSTDGLTWLAGSGTMFSSYGSGLAWNGLKWVAVGTTTNSILTSTDGINWSSTGITGAFAGGRGIGTNTPYWKSVPSSNDVAMQKILLTLYKLNGGPI